MDDTLRHSFRELGSTQLQLRGDLLFTPQTAHGTSYYMVEDPLNSRFFRLGHAEYMFVSMLDGTTTLREALSRLSTLMPNHHLLPDEVAGLCHWLVEMDMAHAAEAPVATIPTSTNSNRGIDNKPAWNPLIFRCPLGRPDRFFEAAERIAHILYSRWALCGWLMLVLFGGYRVFSQWDRFVASSRGILGPQNWIWLAGCWFALKVVHEISHGIVCKRYGGSVRETGILFILFAPLAYVDVTASWRFRSRLQRMHVAAAGMYIELLVAALAAIAWSRGGSHWTNHLCFNLVVMASLSTLLFNANPLMRFDGYYMLCDALNLPNLSINGRHHVVSWCKRNLLGVPTRTPQWPGVQGLVVRTYGWASLAWQFVVYAGLTITAATLWRGGGIVLACLAAGLWLGLPVLRFVRYFLRGKLGEQPRRLRFLFTAGPLATLCIVILVFAPWPGFRQAPAVVEYSPLTVVRAASGGRVMQVHVQPGQQVRAGELLVQLENRQLATQVRDLEIQIRQSELRCRKYEYRGEGAKQQAEAKKSEALRTRLEEKRAEWQDLDVRAPRHGSVIRADLESLKGTYLAVGDEIVSLGDELSKELSIAVSQYDLAAFAQHVGKEVSVAIPRQSTCRSILSRVTPRSTLRLNHNALASVYGGPLAVQESGTLDESEGLELLEPRFTAFVRLNDSQSRSLRAGQRVQVRCRPLDESIGRYVVRAVSHWIRRRMGN